MLVIGRGEGKFVLVDGNSGALYKELELKLMLKLVPSISTHGFFITGLSKSLSAVLSLFREGPYVVLLIIIFSTFSQVFANSTVFFNFSSTNSAKVAIAIERHVQQFHQATKSKIHLSQIWHIDLWLRKALLHGLHTSLDSFV